MLNFRSTRLPLRVHRRTDKGFHHLNAEFQEHKATTETHQSRIQKLWKKVDRWSGRIL